jgi:hypothetical protein
VADASREHLYRKHEAPIQCHRCWIFFKDQDDFKIHAMAANRCEERPGQPTEGFTTTVRKHLRSRKKPNIAQNEDERWRQMYRILFEGEDVPSPCK